MKPVSWLQYCEGVTFLQLDEFLQPKVLSYILYTNTLPKISKQPLNKVSINLYLSPPPSPQMKLGWGYIGFTHNVSVDMILTTHVLRNTKQLNMCTWNFNINWILLFLYYRLFSVFGLVLLEQEIHVHVAS